MILDVRIAAFVEWFAAFLQRFGESIERALVPGAQPELPTTIAPQAASADEPDDPISRAIAAARLAHRLETGVKPVLRALREGCEAVHDRFVAGADVETFLAELAARMGELPETIDAKNGTAVDDEVAPVAEPEAVPLRAWLEAMVLEPAGPQLRAAIAAAAEDTQQALVELERLQKVFDYYLLAVQRHTSDADQPMLVEEFAEAGLLRTKTLVEQFRARRRASAARITAATVRSLSAALEEACAPLRAGRLDEIARALDELRNAALAGAEPPPLWSRWYTGMRRAYVRALPIVREVSRDLRALLANEPQATDDGLRKLVAISLDALGSQLPASYRRLFSGMPAEIADLYVSRSEPELACREAIDGWLAGGGHSLLVAGDRGAGKRTLVNQVLASVRSRAEVHWVRLSREVSSEAAVSESIARELGLPDAPTFHALETALRGLADRRVLVIENAERMFERTVAGVSRMSAFVDLVADTGERTLWILLMSSPAYALLGSALG
ncbi:MAG TPA: AAA family ATPase, partial [Nannocystaceae bacterium]|nr:AAA family ATPase [Nannocystaceae bacterium]